MTTFKELLEAVGVIFLFQALLCATLVVALAWEHHPKGIVSYYRRGIRNDSRRTIYG